MGLRIGVPGSSALQNDGLDVPVILQCRTPRETNPKGHWGPKYCLGKALFVVPHVVLLFLSFGPDRVVLRGSAFAIATTTTSTSMRERHGVLALWA
jgi:hypothetical protein